MTGATPSPDVLIIGGGLIGLACAWRLATDGATVTVLDPTPGAGASNVAAGMLAPVTEVVYGEESHLALTIAAARRWPAFAEALVDASGTDVGYRATGTLVVGFDRDDAAALRDLEAFHAELGLEVEHLDRDALRVREPMLSPRAHVGLAAAEDHRVEPRAVVRALVTATERAGVTIRRTRTRALRRDGGRVRGVTLEDDTVLDAPQVVLAAGAWSAVMDGLPPEATPAVRPLKGQVLHLRDPQGAPVLTTTVRALVRHRHVYLVPRDDGRLVVGASQEERGFDTTVTAGPVRELLDDAVRVVPGIDELALTETIAGLRPTTPDNAPVIGHGGLDGLILATGHHRNGALLTPITTDAVATLATGGTLDAVFACADPGRPAVRPRPAPSDDADRPARPGLQALIDTNRGTR
ncbi:MAG: glycine oxidase ThiO [Nitriliruptoraceae bacterium]|nr:glycine oxidase ThiO [Nitriliruptoraceae bacterium]